jgi:predicted aspartyl protease
LAIDLSQLLGGKQFTVSCKLVFNGYGFKTSALADTGANGYVLINTKYAQRLARWFPLTIHTLPTPIPVRGFDGQSHQAANRYVVLHLHIDGRKQYNVPMVLLDTGYQDLILGRRWFDQLNVQLNPRLGKLVWPADTPKSPDLVKLRLLDSKTLRPQPANPNHQADADRRDQAFNNQESTESTDPLPSVSIINKP